jgi:hypothetical protein
MKSIEEFNAMDRDEMFDEITSLSIDELKQVTMDAQKQAAMLLVVAADKGPEEFGTLLLGLAAHEIATHVISSNDFSVIDKIFETLRVIILKNFADNIVHADLLRSMIENKK